ncbi:MAG: tyrosine-type recombinase/integrase [Lachnospiraceae bacterium]
MSEKRKDNKGRILRTGESQRNDLTYEFRYTDITGKRKSVYAKNLQELRKREARIQKDIDDGINYCEGTINTIELVERYVALKQGVRHATKVGYNFVLNLIRKEDFCYRRINTIRTSDAKLWLMKLQQDGRGYSTITSVRGVVKPAFQMACDEDIIRKNPFDFPLTGVVVNDSRKRIALTPEQQETFMNFVKEDSHYCRYYDEFNVLLGTGMRVSEFCGLTMEDLDFASRKIRVEKQLIRENKGAYHVEKTKTESGVRFIPMSDEVYQSLKNILANRKKPQKERMVDGYTGFILLDKNGNPKLALHLEHHMQWTMKKYRKTRTEPLPTVTPHVLRHTFCTNMANAGMDLKSLQYLMGHSDAGVTMNVYTHASYAHAEESMQKILKLGQKEDEAKTG